MAYNTGYTTIAENNIDDERSVYVLLIIIGWQIVTGTDHCTIARALR